MYARSLLAGWWRELWGLERRDVKLFWRLILCAIIFLRGTHVPSNSCINGRVMTHSNLDPQERKDWVRQSLVMCYNLAKT